MIFVGSVLFALLTVLLSCSKPGKMAARVSPVEATKYTDAMQTKKKQRSTRGAKLHQMAFANLGRNKKKTVLVVVSLALSVTLFNALCAFVGGFSMEKYVSFMTCADFIVSTPDYFRYNPADEFITPEQIEEIAANTKASLSGTGYAVRKPAYLWMAEDALRQDYARYESAEQLDSHMSRMEHRGNMVMGKTRIEALDNSLFDKLQVFDGDISPMLEPNNNAIAIAVSLDDYGNLPRRREFAVLQAVGMTNRQLKTMLIYEGLFYAISSVSAAFILSLAVGPLAGKMLGSMFWFFEYRFTILPVLLTIPVFLLLGWLIPCMMYDNAAKCSVVEQLRDAQ